MLSTGFTIFVGVVLILAKLPRRMMLRVLKHDLLLDVAVSLITLMIHWGTFSGVMAATVAGLLTSIATSSLKKLVGYIERDTYYPGRLRLDVLAVSVRWRGSSSLPQRARPAVTPCASCCA